MVVILRDHESRDGSIDAVFVSDIQKVGMAEYISKIIDTSREQVGDTDNYDWEDIVARLPKDIKAYASWQDEIDEIYW